jgi:tRNA1Val (adenine37-N6)-methyltransferase
MAKAAPLQDPILGPLTDDRLTRDYRVFQREKGHRFSADDVATAYVALAALRERHPEAGTGAGLRIVDLGTGLGSVLLHLAWQLPAAHFVGIEAQAMSFELLRRNVARNELQGRIAIHHGDLRDEALVASLGTGYPLVTGTPPYFPPSTAVDAMDEQRAYARIEYRGGVEAYVTAGATLIARDGLLVLCGDSDALPRVERSASEHGLAMVARHDIVPFAGRRSLFSIWTLARAATVPAPMRLESLTLRDERGHRTDDASRLREFSGFGPIAPDKRDR